MFICSVFQYGEKGGAMKRMMVILCLGMIFYFLPKIWAGHEVGNGGMAFLYENFFSEEPVYCEECQTVRKNDSKIILSLWNKKISSEILFDTMDECLKFQHLVCSK